MKTEWCNAQNTGEFFLVVLCERYEFHAALRDIALPLA
jgi:hypothetical protein